MSEPIGTDVSGYRILTNAMLDLLSQYPGLDGREILFEELSERGGIAFSADNGALIMTEHRSITDHVWQECRFPIYIIYRVAITDETQSLRVQAFFDSLGKWLCKEPATVNGSPISPAIYPALSDGRRITRITRSNSYALAKNEDGVQDWLMPVTVEYTNEFYM